MPDRYYEQKHFIEDISLYFEQMGMPRMAGRILGVLLITNPPEQSIDDLCEILQASKSAISTSTRLLVEMGMIERAPSQMPRRVYFRFVTGGWLVFLRMRMRLMASLHPITEQGLDLLKDESPEIRARLQEAHDVFSLLEEQLPEILRPFDARRGSN